MGNHKINDISKFAIVATVEHFSVENKWRVCITQSGH